MLKSQLSSGDRLPRPTFCPQRLFPLIKTCWNENPCKRPSFTEIKEHMYRDPVFPQGYVTHDTNENTLSVPTTYEIMRTQYDTIQRSNPYLSMAVKSYEVPEKIQNGKKKDDADLTEQKNLPLISCEIDTSVINVETSKRTSVNKESENTNSDIIKFLAQSSQESKIINV